jgi:hypothetical protein
MTSIFLWLFLLWILWKFCCIVWQSVAAGWETLWDPKTWEEKPKPKVKPLTPHKPIR